MASRSSVARKQAPFVGLALAAALLWMHLLWPRPQRLKVAFLDVGQGDAAVAELPGGETLLVDFGPRSRDAMDPWDAGKSVVLPYLRYEGISRIDVALLSHPHEDHAGGLGYLLDHVPTRLFVDSGQTWDSEGYHRALDAARRDHVPYCKAQAGDCFRFQDGVTLSILSPGPVFMVGTRDDCNNNSLVALLRWGRRAVLFTGDIEDEAEAPLISQLPRVDVLKVAHHGSQFSTSRAFLERTRPRLAVISCGKGNSFGFPAPSTLERLDAAGASVFRTDQDGAVLFETDGQRERARSILSHREIEWSAAQPGRPRGERRLAEPG